MPQASLLSHRTAQRITELIEKNTSIRKTAQSSDSTFYQIRVVKITSSWSSGKCDAVLLDEDGDETDQEIELHKAPGISTGSSSGDKVWAVYRGKWQELSSTSNSGHIIRTISSAVTGSGTTNVTIDGETVAVGCPLLRSGETIASGSKVVLSKNYETGDWQIIEAQCPSS